MATRSRMIVRYLLIITIVAFMSSCAHKPVQKEEPPPGSYLEKIYTTPNTKTDLEMFREAMPPYIDFLSNSLDPKLDDDKLLCRVAGAYYGYAYCLVEDRNRKDASELFLKGRDLAMRELKYYRIFSQALAYKLSIDAFRKSLDESFTNVKAPVIYWAAMNWGGWICINLNKPDAREDIPKVQAMLEFVNAFDDSYENGSVHAMLGALYAVQPKMEGGDPARAKDEFEKAFSCSFSSTLTYQVMYARYYAYPMRDKALFTGTLQSVIDKPANYYSDMNFVNEVAKKKAGILIKNIDKYFKPAKDKDVKKVAAKKPAAQGAVQKPAAVPLVPAVQAGAPAPGVQTATQGAVTPGTPQQPSTETAPPGTGAQETPPQPAGQEAPGTVAPGTSQQPAAEGAQPGTSTPESTQPPATETAPPGAGAQETPPAVQGPPQSTVTPEAPQAVPDGTQPSAGVPGSSQSAAPEAAPPSTGAQEKPPAVQGAPQSTVTPEAPQALPDATQPSAGLPGTSQPTAPEAASPGTGAQETPPAVQGAPQSTVTPEAPQALPDATQPSASLPGSSQPIAPEAASSTGAQETPPAVQEAPQSTVAETSQPPAAQDAPQTPGVQDAAQQPNVPATPQGSAAQ